MDSHEMAGLAILGLAALIFLYQAQHNSQSQPIPQVQSELHVMGLGVGANFRVNPGTVLDLNPELHFWVPAFDPDPTATPTTLLQHRYPALPGGNLSTVMHKGWSALMHDSPVGNEWRIAPPEVAVL